MAHDHLPPQLTSFIGRAHDLAEIAAMLADAACRLLTLTGPGGIGKTRLAIQAASDAGGRFADGVWYAALQPVSSPEYLVPALVDTLHLRLHGSDSPRAQLLRRLHTKELLLVVDSFEHLLGEVALLSEILETAPGVKLLVTSRETLNVREEWVRPVGAMRVPISDQVADPEHYDAVALFIERARQASGDFVIDRERQHIVRICQLVDGLPLAIELAAAQVRTLSCTQIAAELQHGMDILATTLRNVSERHRNMYAVFEPCWSRLTPPQREVFMQLSVFRGGFTRQAAEQVTGASLPVLDALVNKSLLRLAPTGRYEMHELVRQYAEARRLDEMPSDNDRVQDRHCVYYADFLHRHEPDLKGPNLLLAMAEIMPEIDNVRRMWRWAVRKRMEQEIEKSLDSLALIYHIQCWYQEAEENFRMAVAELGNERSVVLGRSLMWQGQFSAILYNIFSHQRSRQLLQEGASVLRELNVYGKTAMPLWLLSELDNDPTIREETEQFCLDNLDTYRERGDRWGTVWALIGLGNLPLLQGAYEEAREYSEEALLIARDIGDKLAIAAALQALIKVARGKRAYEQLRRYAQEAFTLAKAIGDRGGIAAAQFALGRAAFKLGMHEEAKKLLEQSVLLYQEVFPGDVGPLVMLGELALAMGSSRQAKHYLDKALRSAQEDSRPLALTAIARLLAAEGQEEEAVRLLAATASYSQWTRYPVHAELKPLLADLEARLLPDDFAAAVACGEASDLKRLTVDLLSELEADAESPFMDADLPDALRQPSAESLSARELEVLRLVAQGWSNREIAQELVVTVGTVKKHLNNIFSKLHVRNRTQAILRARALDLLF